MSVLDKKDQVSGKNQIKKSRGIIEAATRSTSQDLLAIKLKNEQFQK